MKIFGFKIGGKVPQTIVSSGVGGTCKNPASTVNEPPPPLGASSRPSLPEPFHT